MTLTGDECIGDSRTLLISPVDGSATAGQDAPVRLMLAFKIDKIRELMSVARPGQYLVSQPSTSPLCPQLVWRLRLYPNGSCAEKEGHLSFYLWQIGIMDPNSSLPATFRIYLLDDGGSETTICGGDVTFDAGQREWGKSTVAHELLLGKPKKGGSALIHGDGALMIVCEVSHPRQLASGPVISENSEMGMTGAVDGAVEPLRRRGVRGCYGHKKDRMMVTEQFEVPTKGELAEWRRLLKKPTEIGSRQDELYTQLFPTLNAEGKIPLQLTARGKCAVLLVADQQSGLIRSFHIHSNKFVCTPCSSLADRSQRRNVAVGIAENGKIQKAGDKDHHPKCVGKSKAEIIKLQLARRLNLAKSQYNLRSNGNNSVAKRRRPAKNAAAGDDPNQVAVATNEPAVEPAIENVAMGKDDGSGDGPDRVAEAAADPETGLALDTADGGENNGGEDDDAEDCGDDGEMSVVAPSIDPSVHHGLY